MFNTVHTVGNKEHFPIKSELIRLTGILYTSWKIQHGKFVINAMEPDEHEFEQKQLNGKRILTVRAQNWEFVFRAKLYDS